jgi:hypothetical protein
MVPQGRLVRLGVVLDAGSDEEHIHRLALLAERAGIDALWLVPFAPELAPPAAVVLRRLAAAAGPTTSLLLGAWLEAIPASVPGPLQGRLEVTVPAPAFGSAPPAIRRVDPAVSGPSVEVPGADLIVVPAPAVPLTGPPEPAAPVPLAVLAMCSIGRTSAEARARAEGDPLFSIAGHPSDGGLFGTLEECQQWVLALARRGVVDVRCVLPTSRDVHDVIAQLSAVATGSLTVLAAAERSPDPPPPVGWGGRRSQ